MLKYLSPEQSRSHRGKLFWYTYSGLSICCTIAVLTQIMDMHFNESKTMTFQSMNKIVEYLKINMMQILIYPNLHVYFMNFGVYLDALFAPNANHTSQFCYVIFLVDKFNKCQPIHCTFQNSKLVCRSVHGSEVIAFADVFDLAYAIKWNLQNVSSLMIPLSFMTNSFILSDFLPKSAITAEKCLMIDLQTVKFILINKS